MSERRWFHEWKASPEGKGYCWICECDAGTPASTVNCPGPQLGGAAKALLMAQARDAGYSAELLKLQEACLERPYNGDSLLLLGSILCGQAFDLGQRLEACNEYLESGGFRFFLDTQDRHALEKIARSLGLEP